MGVLPLVKNMPLRLTETQHTDSGKKYNLFKNKRCKLFGWTLHADDQKKLQETEEEDLILEHLPESLFIALCAYSLVIKET